MTAAPAGAPGTLAQAARVLTRWTLEGVALLHLDGGEPVILTGPGATLWSMLEAGPARRDDLVAGLAARYGVEPEFVAHEIDDVVDQLLALRLLGIDVPGPRSTGLVDRLRGADAGV